MKVSFILCVALASVLCVVILLARPATSETAPRRVEVTAHRSAFAPGEISLKKGQPVILVLKSSDVAHGLRFRELNLEVKVKKGGTTEMRFTPRKTGTFVGHCSVFCGSGHGAMTLTLHVVE
jgi:cytochrome c oxidase subunit II